MGKVIQLNPSASQWTCAPPPQSSVEGFHRSLADYNETHLHSLPDLASSLGISHLLLKDESNRFGLPAFKIVGASWAVYKAVCQKVNLAPTVSLEEVGKAAREQNVKLVTCTEGNWGRAVARMGKLMGVKVRIYVPWFMTEGTQAKIRSEGAEVLVVEGGNYDDTISASRKDSEVEGALLVMDTSWEGYEEIPEWVVEGYSTMLTETDRQLFPLTNNKRATHAIVPVGVGSIAQAVTQNFKSSLHADSATVVTVEPDTAAGFQTSLSNGKITTVSTEDSIMCGMNCGTVSMTAWEVLKRGVDIAVAVTDLEAHDAVQELHARGIMAGPCGAATLAALRRLVLDGAGGLDKNSVVVLFCTEGAREYVAPTKQ